MKYIMNYLKYFLLVFGTLCFISCKTTESTVASNDKKPVKNLSQEDALQSTALFIDANREKIIGNYDKALGLFSQCIKKNPEYAAALYEMASILNDNKKYNDALVYALKSEKIDQENKWYKLLLVNIYENLREYDKASLVLKKLINKYPNEVDYYYELANLYIAVGDYNEALKSYDQMEKQLGIEEEIILQKEKIYIKLNKLNKAIEEIQKLITLFPSETRFYGMLAEIYLYKGMPIKAFDIYQKILQISPDDPYVHLSLADYYRMQNDIKESFHQLELAFLNKSLEIDTKIKILLSLYNLPDTDNSIKENTFNLTEILISVHPDDAKSYSIYGDFLYKDKKFLEARNQFRNVIKLDSSKYLVWQQLLIIDSELDDNESMASESNRAISIFPEQAELYYLNGLANYNLKKYDTAINILNKGLNLSYNSSLNEKIYTIIGDSYYKLKKYHNSFSAYEEVLKLSPNNSFVLNNYSYYLALVNENLTLAEKMAKKVNEINPGNSSYEDTYAWVLFKMKNFYEAQIWLEKAIKDGGGENFTIIDHYGDILFKLGQTDKAVEYWEKAKKLGMNSEILNKKIDNKLYYE